MKPPRHYGKHGQARSSLSRLLKTHIRHSADGRKVVSHATINDRAKCFTLMIKQLHELGYAIRNLHNFKPKHAHALMRHWEAQGLSAPPCKSAGRT